MHHLNKKRISNSTLFMRLINAIHTEVYFLLPLDPILLVLNVKRTHEILIFANLYD